MIVHRPRDDVGRGHDVAQRDVGEAGDPHKAVRRRLRIAVLVIRTACHGPMRQVQTDGVAFQTVVMKLWFEDQNVNAHDAIAIRPIPRRPPPPR